jgi:hypothetical protein
LDVLIVVVVVEAKVVPVLEDWLETAVDLDVVLVDAVVWEDAKVFLVRVEVNLNVVIVVDVDVVRVVVVLVKYIFAVRDVVVLSETVSVLADIVVVVEVFALLRILLIVVKIGYFPWLQNAFVKSSKSKAHIIAPLKDLLNIKLTFTITKIRLMFF